MSNSIFTTEQLIENYNMIVRLLSEVQADNVHMQKSLDMLERMHCESVPGDIAGQAKANSACEIVKSRETTNQKLIDAYMKMYDDLKTAVFSQNTSCADITDKEIKTETEEAADGDK